MIDAPGIIIALDGDFALVRTEETGCGRCHEEGGCRGNNIGTMFCKAPRSFRVPNPGRSAVGDRVSVVIDAGAVRRGAALAYGLPLLALFAGALIGSALAGDLGAIVGSICGLSCAWLGLRYVQARGSPDQRTQPHIRH